MKDFDRSEIRSLLARLGELLEARRQGAALVIVGGAALNLMEVVSRRTVDVDVLAIGTVRLDGPPVTVMVPERLPPEVLEAAARLSRDLGIPADWINTVVTASGALTLPPGFAERVQWEQLNGLWLGIAGRWDLIALKLHAAVDTDVRSRHFADLLALTPTTEELDTAVAWVRSQDAGPGFSALLDQVTQHVRTHSR